MTKIQIQLIGFLTLLNRKMKGVLTVLALLLNERAVIFSGEAKTFFAIWEKFGGYVYLLTLWGERFSISRFSWPLAARKIKMWGSMTNIFIFMGPLVAHRVVFKNVSFLFGFLLIPFLCISLLVLLFHGLQLPSEVNYILWAIIPFLLFFTACSQAAGFKSINYSSTLRLSIYVISSGSTNSLVFFNFGYFLHLFILLWVTQLPVNPDNSILLGAIFPPEGASGFLFCPAFHKCKSKGRRNYSSNKSPVIVPVMKYENADLDKLRIIQENKGKSGIYCFKNQLNGRCYIGSSVNLSRRFSEYYSIQFLERALKSGNSAISLSLIKYGYSAFSLEILEYCEPSEAVLREQYYLDLFQPEYNILKTAGSRAGHKHTEETKAKLAAGWTPKRKALMVAAWTSERKAKYLEQLKEQVKRLQLLISKSVEVLDTLNNEKLFTLQLVKQHAQLVAKNPQSEKP